jgi:hypothetical protein|tara:strand:+ start:1046 stop:1249 length:204 start_codon:yes stop_codon:yes gene_type:complete
MMDRDTHRLVHFLKYNEKATDLDIHLLGIFDVRGAMKRAKKHGYTIKTKTSGLLWNQNTTYYLKTQE